MAAVRLVNVTKVYANGIRAIDSMNLEVLDKEFMVLVGPSGCGKSTILRVIAGLEEVTNGEIYIDGAKINDVSPKDRDIAMIFQDFALYPHMDVFGNIAFGLKMRKVPKDEVARRVAETAKVLGIQGLLRRKPRQISGGERQRVALGRAIVRNPKVFLMDEPLSNLDAKLRVQMRLEIHRLHRNLDTTFIYVTHDQTEAMTMGTRIAVLKDGAIQQVDTPREVYAKPANTFVASFIGTPPMNLIEGHLVREEDRICLRCPNGSLLLPDQKGQRAQGGGYSEGHVILGIRPEHIRLVADQECRNSSLAGEVEVVENMGAESCASVVTPCGSLLMRVSTDTQLSLGQSVRLGLDPEHVHLFSARTSQRIVSS
jgi:multiple sugar transport system ATP-binding protein